MTNSFCGWVVSSSTCLQKLSWKYPIVFGHRIILQHIPCYLFDNILISRLWARLRGTNLLYIISFFKEIKKKMKMGRTESAVSPVSLIVILKSQCFKKIWILSREARTFSNHIFGALPCGIKVKVMIWSPSDSWTVLSFECLNQDCIWLILCMNLHLFWTEDIKGDWNHVNPVYFLFSPRDSGIYIMFFHQ